MKVRIILRNRSGLPRSAMSATAPTPAAASAVSRLLRRSRRRPVSCAPSASSDEPPATPPRKKYAPISCFHGGAFTIGRP